MKNVIFLTLSGSRLYGTDVQDSDRDYRGVFIPSLIDMLSPFKQVKPIHRAPDTVLYPVTDFARMVADGAMTAVELLFAPPTFADLRWSLILHKKDCLLSRRLVAKAIGHASAHFSQFEKTGDWKDAMHAVRILTQTLTLLEDRPLTFPLPNAPYLRSIRAGQVADEQVRADFQQALQDVRDAEKITRLPAEPDYNDIEDLLLEVFTL